MFSLETVNTPVWIDFVVTGGFFEVEQETHMHLQTCIWHFRSTETATTMGYSTVFYPSETTPSCSHSILA